MPRHVVLAAVGLLIGATAWGAGAVEKQAALDQFTADNPATYLYREAGQIIRLYGEPFSFGNTPEEAAATFVQAYAPMLGADSVDLAPGNHYDDLLTLPMMYDEALGDYRLILVYYAQFSGGTPVFESELRLMVRNEPGYPLVWVGNDLHDLGDFVAPAVAASRDPGQIGHAAALALLPDLVEFTPSEYVVWPGTPGPLGQPPRLAVKFIADNGLQATADYVKHMFLADALTGEILLDRNMIIATNVTGSVHGQATTLPKSAECNPEVDTVMPYAQVAIGSTTAYADANGNFTITNSGTTAVTVTSYMSGQRFTVTDAGGSLETLTLSVTPPGPANFMHNSANTSEFIRAEVNAYVQANVVRDWLLTYCPTYPTISSQTGFPLHCNINSSCNAYYDYSSLNFYRNSGGCANSAYSNVIHHEYGHHVVDRAGSAQDQWGEGVGDTIAMLIADDPILGYGFELNCNAGIRTAVNTMQYPCTAEIHECAQLLSGTIWSTRNEMIVTNPATYQQILSNLFVNAQLLHGTSGSITPALYTDFVTLDNSYYAGAHVTEITTGFQAHNMVPLPPASDACATATVACPGTFSGSSSGMTNDGSAGCGSSNSTADVWFKYTPASSGTLDLNLCDSDYDTVLSVHSGCPGTSSNQLACNDDTGWFGTCSWLPTDQSALSLSVTAGQTYLIRISGNSATGNYVLAVSGPACAPSDTSPPTPNPMTFASPPAAISASQISMTATTATDAGSPPVQYEFEFVSGGSGGTSGSWQSSTQYTDGGLTADTSYTYRVRARDSAATPNATGFSGNAAATTWALVPAAPTLSNATTNTLDLDVNANGNPSYTVLAVRCTATSPLDAAWDGKYVNASGQASAGEVWQTDAQWGTLTVTGLQPATAYTFAVKARNQTGVQTAFGSGATLTTNAQYPPGDMNCDGTTNNQDIDPFVLALFNPAGYAAQYPGCDILNGDFTDDGFVNNQDIDGFVAALFGG